MSNESSKYELPKGWVWIPLKDISIPPEKANQKNDTPFDYIDIEAIDNLNFTIGKSKRHTWESAPSRAQQIILTGDTLFSTVRPYLKNIALVTPKYDRSIASSGFCVIIRPLIINPVYVHNFVLTQYFIDSINNLAKGTSYPAVTSKIIQDQLLPVPPIQEQNRIVSKIEELFSELSQFVHNF